jgi:hypothetical protein
MVVLAPVYRQPSIAILMFDGYRSRHLIGQSWASIFRDFLFCFEVHLYLAVLCIPEKRRMRPLQILEKILVQQGYLKITSKAKS